MLLVRKLLKNRSFLIKQITLDLVIYFLIIFFINQIFNLVFFNYFYISVWIFSSYLFDRYHLRGINHNLLLKYFFKTSLIYFLLSLINYFFINNFLLHTIFCVTSLFSQILLVKINLKYLNSKQKWLTNDTKIFKLYNSSKTLFRNNILYLYDKKYKFDFDNYEGFLIDCKSPDYLSFMTFLKKKKKVKKYLSLDWCEEFIELIPLDLLHKSDFYEKILTCEVGNFFGLLKRLFEFILSLFILILCLPTIAIFSILVFLQDGLPILYSQLRTGINNKNIRIYKIRSMKKDSEKNGPQWSTKYDTRVTLIGRLIRKYRIDELPQLLSVFNGDLSLIGPRPERPEIDKILKKDIIFYEKRYVVNPGITGWAQVNYPYTASLRDARIKQSYDLYYVKNVSIILDLIIVFKTIRLILNRRGAAPLTNK
tara:strand:+ start:3576 stop:4847 length:1272 start_codon:yes stop_codon:yes gene_type:complete